MILAVGQTSLPYPLQLAGLVTSLVLAAFKTIEFFQRPKLSLHLTKDVYFRLIDKGEALFCNGVLLAINGPILVRSVDLLLKRIDKRGKAERAEKTFPMLVSQHGEKVKGPNAIADHSFFGSSALHYLESSKPFRAVYLCLQKEYQNQQQRAVDEFALAVEDFKTQNLGSQEEDAPKLRTEFEKLIDKHFHALSSLIQLEAGDYELEMKVLYDRVGWKFVGVKGETSSKISFSVEDTTLQKWRVELKRMLENRGQQIVSGNLQDIKYPQLEPRNIEELSC